MSATNTDTYMHIYTYMDIDMNIGINIGVNTEIYTLAHFNLETTSRILRTQSAVRTNPKPATRSKKGINLDLLL